MRYYSYVISRDFGFAPNPYFDYCTLATCKPVIRRTAQKGDWIAGFGASGTKYKRKLLVLMQVDEILSFDQYWEDKRFKKKRPVFNRSITDAYGDNIYHHVNGEWFQEASHHSMIDGSINYTNLKHDTQTNRVLISKKFYYFGNNAIELPKEFSSLVGQRRNYRVCEETTLVDNLVKYIGKSYKLGINGIPSGRKSGKFAHYKGES